MKAILTNRSTSRVITALASLLALLAVQCKTLGQQPAQSFRTQKEVKAPILEEMLSIALKHNPDVQAAEAMLRAAEAELDRTRLQVVRNVTAFRAKWQAQQSEVAAAQAELKLRSAGRERVSKLSEQGVIGQEKLAEVEHQLVSARNKLAFAQAKLAELEAEMPFLLGKPAERRAADSDTTKKKAKAMLEVARTTFELKMRAIQKGEARDMDQMYPWSRRWLDAERAASRSKADRITALESHLARMKQIYDVAQQLQKAGELGRADVVAFQFYIAEAELWISQAKDQ
jgi:outer membrane protein TolC